MTGAIPIQNIRGILLASVQSELRDDVATGFQKDVLRSIERSGASGLIIDISAMEIVDSFVAQVLANTGKMAQLMGTETVLVGMRPEVAATLIAMGIDIDVETALNVDDGLTLLHARAESAR
jgi:rsbT antagonist protein RsbS